MILSHQGIVHSVLHLQLPPLPCKHLCGVFVARHRRLAHERVHASMAPELTEGRKALQLISEREIAVDTPESMKPPERRCRGRIQALVQQAGHSVLGERWKRRVKQRAA